jgi:hypothetical protein
MFGRSLHQCGHDGRAMIGRSPAKSRDWHEYVTVGRGANAQLT